MMSSGFTPRRKPTISLDPKRMGSFDRIGAVPSSRNTSARLRDYLPPQLWNLLNDTTGSKGSRAALVLAGALVLTVMVCFGVFGGGGGGDARHVVVFDAGSTGNRVHVFEFENTRDGTPPRLVDEVFHAEKPGFKEMAKDPHAAAALLDPLVELRGGQPFGLDQQEPILLLPAVVEPLSEEEPAEGPQPGLAVVA